MSKNYGIKDVESWKFNEVEIPEEWRNHLGNITENFRMIIEGKSGHGKTEYVIKLAKMLAKYYGKVHLNSTEQGKSSTLQQAFARNKVAEEVEPGKLMLGDRSQKTFEGWFNKVQKPNSGRVLILDSIDYMHLTFDQYQKLHERFPHKAIIMVCWNDPMDTNSKKIKYMCDMKVEVKDYKAYNRTRFGGIKPLIIWDKRPSNGQLTIGN